MEKEKIKTLLKQKKSKEKGITLIALVITIIVLLILAAVSIATLTGENGILTRANDAKEQTEEVARKEEEALDIIELQIQMKEKGEIANSPKLKDGMIAVKWNGESWVKADKENRNNDWYDYNENSRKWANVVTVKEEGTKSREEYIETEIGTKIEIEDITTMFVWIPRYSYKITSGYHEVANGTGEIEIKFLIGSTDSFVDGSGEAIRSKETNGENYVVHPSFTEDIEIGGIGEEITGFWVGKFESSNSEAVINNEGYTNNTDKNILYGGGNTTTKKVTIRPNVTSWRAINVNNIYTVCKEMTKKGNIHGLNQDTEITMMKNSQWGAVAYLTQSNYGNKQISTDSASGVWNNPYTEGFTYNVNDNNYGMANYCTTLTGMAGESRNINTSQHSKLIEGSKNTNADGSITISYININSDGSEGTTYTRTFYHYDSENGQKASTTKNVYGIYDMAGGSNEYMASYLEGGDNYYTQNFSKIDKKYRTTYKGEGEGINEEDCTINYEANKDMYGDAKWETSQGTSGEYSWNGDHSYFPYLTNPFFNVGGFFSYTSTAGIFCFGPATGSSYINCSFRCVAF